MPFEIQACSDLPSPDLTRFMNGNNLSFNNLDWFSPEERFNQPGSFAIVEDHQIKAILAATPENPSTAWLRFYHVDRRSDHAKCFANLIGAAKNTLQKMGARGLFALAPYSWLESLLLAEGFKPADTIVTLQRDFPVQSTPENDDEIVIREMTQRDLVVVEEIDVAAFEPAWQLNPVSLERTYHRTAWHSVALLEREIVGYQMSTSIFDTAHLARLAVHPRYQHRGLGRRLAQDMLETFSAFGVTSFSVNTQSSNASSLALYQSLQYQRENHDILVMSLDI